MIALTPDLFEYLVKCNKIVKLTLENARARDRAWTLGDRRGRWVVLEHPKARLLSPTRRYDPRRRGRRFSSLSRARHFAHQVNGEVRRWHAHQWRKSSPWEFALLGLAPFIGTTNVFIPGLRSE